MVVNRRSERPILFIYSLS